MTTTEIKRGNTWNPAIEVLKDDVAFDCTNYTVKLYIKKELKESAAAVEILDIGWTSQVNGQGTFALTNEMSKDLQVRLYYFEINLYTTADQTLVKTLFQGKLDVVEALEKDFT